MNIIQKIQAANKAATAVIQALTNADAPDVVALRTEELKAMKKDDLIAHIISLEAPKTEGGVKIEALAKAVLTTPECACLTYEQVAQCIQQAVPEAKTSSKSIASYVSKHKEWPVISRERIKFDMASLVGCLPDAQKLAVNN